MTALPCADVLGGRAPKDTPVTVKGWVRTRRDSKAGISFVQRRRRVLLPPGPGRGAQHPAQLRRRGAAPDGRLRGGGHRHRRALAREGAAVRAAGDRDQGARLGRRSGLLPDPAEAAHARVPARGRAPAAADERDRRRDARAPHASRRRSTASSTSAASSGSTRRSSRRPTPRARARCSACRRSISRTCRARPTAKIDFAQDFFGRETFLTVSGQLNVESYCLALSKVYTFGPTFRAENSNTSRHLAEFWMIEPEIAFADLADDASLAEALLKHIFRDAARRARRRHGVLRGAHREGR